MLMQIDPLIFCHKGTKRNVLWPSKYAKIHFRPGLCPGPRWGISRRSLEPPSRLEGTPLPIPHLTRHRPTFSAGHASPRIPARSMPMYTVSHLIKKITPELTLDRVWRRSCHRMISVTILPRKKLRHKSKSWWIMAPPVLWLPCPCSGYIGRAAPVSRWMDTLVMSAKVVKELRSFVTLVPGHFGLFYRSEWPGTDVIKEGTGCNSC